MASKTRVVPLGSYPAGVYPIPPTALPNGLNGIMFLVGRNKPSTPTLWPNASTRFEVRLVYSTDGGITYGGDLRSGGVGGLYTDKAGNILAETVIGFGINPDNATHAKGALEIFGGPLLSYVDMVIA